MTYFAFCPVGVKQYVGLKGPDQADMKKHTKVSRDKQIKLEFATSIFHDDNEYIFSVCCTLYKHRS